MLLLFLYYVPALCQVLRKENLTFLEFDSDSFQTGSGNTQCSQLKRNLDLDGKSRQIFKHLNIRRLSARVTLGKMAEQEAPGIQLSTEMLVRAV